MLKAGDVLDERYEILSQTGEDEKTLSFKAMHRLMKKPVAVRVLKQPFADDPAQVELFKQQTIAEPDSNQQASTVHDFGVAPDGMPFLVMDLSPQQGHREDKVSSRPTAATLKVIFAMAAFALAGSLIWIFSTDSGRLVGARLNYTLERAIKHDSPAALESLSRVVDLDVKLNDLQAAVQAQEELVKLERARSGNSYRLAVQYIRLAKIYEQLGDSTDTKANAVKALDTLMSIYLRNTENPKVLEKIYPWILSAYTMAKLPPSKETARYLVPVMSLNKIQGNNQNWPASMKICLELLPLIQNDPKSRVGYYFTLLSLNSALYFQGRYLDAYEPVERAIKLGDAIFQFSDDPQPMAIGLLQAGLNAFVLERNPEAESYLERAIKLMDASHQTYQRGEYVFPLSTALKKQDKFEEALSLFNEHLNKVEAETSKYWCARDPHIAMEHADLLKKLKKSTERESVKERWQKLERKMSAPRLRNY